MRMTMIGIFITMLMFAGNSGAVAVHFDDTPPKTIAAAKAMKCKITDRDSYIGPKNAGVTCVRRSEMYAVLQYDNPRKAVAYWKDWIDEGYFARKKNVFVLPQGVDGMNTYSLEAAEYAAERIGGKVIAG
jgi:hypothetical protein